MGPPSLSSTAATVRDSIRRSLIGPVHPSQRKGSDRRPDHHPGGDLKNGRTVHSLAPLLANYGVRFYFVAPVALAMPGEITTGLRARGIELHETPDLAEATARSDILYMTRIQQERFTTGLSMSDSRARTWSTRR